MKNYDYLIVGAGLYGCTIAERLDAHGYKVLVIDKRDRIGGNCASVDMNGIDVHLYGPHVFHTSNKEVWKYINQFGDFRQFTHKVMSYYNGNVYNFPINKKTMHDFNNNENWSYFDEEIFNAFYKEYSEKQWNCKFEDIPVKVLNRIPIRDNYNDSYFNDFYTGIPIDGYNALFETMIKGIDIELNTNSDIISNSKYKWDKIIYTGPIDKYFDYEYGQLQWRSLKFEIVELNIKDFQGISVMHYPEKRYPYTRITEFKHFNPFNEAYKKDHTIYAAEFPITDNENPYYPIETEENINKYLKYFELSQEYKNIHFAGRLGTYKYNDMDVTVANALSDFNKIINGEIF